MRIINLLNSTCLVLLFACSDDDSVNDNTIKFETTAESMMEDDSTHDIMIVFDNPSAASSSLYFEINGTASLNGDFKVVTPSPVTINAQDKAVIIQIQLIDEDIVESSEEVEITLTGVGNGLSLGTNPDGNTFKLTIEDNDTAPDEGVQIDLTWKNETEMDIDEFDLDLYIANNVTIEDNQVTDFDFYSKSENPHGFETTYIDGAAPDGEYYIVVVYKSGDTDIEFSLGINGAGISNEKIDGNFTTKDVGTGIFYGPIGKDGALFNARKGRL